MTPTQKRVAVTLASGAALAVLAIAVGTIHGLVYGRDSLGASAAEATVATTSVAIAALIVTMALAVTRGKRP